MNVRPHAALVRWCLALAALLSVPCAAAQQKYTDFESLAADVANAIQKSPEAATEIPKVRTFAFVERYSSPTELAYQLSTQFAGLLQKDAEVASRYWVPMVFAKQSRNRTSLASGLFSSSSAMRCYASELGATMLVEGTMRIAADGAVIDVTVWSAKARAVIFSESAIVPMTLEMMDLAARKAPPIDPPDISTHEKRVWVNPDHPSGRRRTNRSA